MVELFPPGNYGSALIRRSWLSMNACWKQNNMAITVIKPYNEREPLGNISFEDKLNFDNLDVIKVYDDGLECITDVDCNVEKKAITVEAMLQVKVKDLWERIYYKRNIFYEDFKDTPALAKIYNDYLIKHGYMLDPKDEIEDEHEIKTEDYNEDGTELYNNIEWKDSDSEDSPAVPKRDELVDSTVHKRRKENDIFK
jgi:hypothetical protein